jgi:penicillin-binding protein 2
MNFVGRKYIILALFIGIGVIYSLKLLYMQVLTNTWSKNAIDIVEMKRIITPPRGVVYDRTGKKIISNRTYYNLCFVEDNIENLDTQAFAKLLNVPDTFIAFRFKEIVAEQGKYHNKITGKTTSNYRSSREYVFLEELSNDEIARIAPELYRFKGFYEVPTNMRNYPYQNGANIVGYLAEVSPEEMKNDPFYNRGDLIGKAGIEKFYEKELRGKKGVKYLVQDAQNNATDSYKNGQYDTLSVQGKNLKLGIDIDLQAYGEKLMQNKLGCIVAIEPSSGEILALVSSPSYDPNLLVGARNINENYTKLISNKYKPLYPRPLAAEYPPGSIFKLVQALIGLQEGVITETSSFPCNKSIVGCHNHPSATSIDEAVKFSCNPYFYAVTRRIIQQDNTGNLCADAEIGLRNWVNYVHKFGLGIKPETDISGLRSGLIPDVSFYDKWYGHHRWAFSTIRSISIGQGEVKLTPLQMANLAAIMANKGWYYPPHFVKSIGNGGPLPEYTKKHSTDIDRKYYDIVDFGMMKVVNAPGGTAHRAKIDSITVAGKTGTAQNPHGKDHSVFIGFAPYENPKIAIAVFTENSGFGGTWSAPTASLMIEKYLRGTIKDKAKEQRILEANLLPNESY